MCNALPIRQTTNLLHLFGISAPMAQQRKEWKMVDTRRKREIGKKEPIIKIPPHLEFKLTH